MTNSSRQTLARPRALMGMIVARVQKPYAPFTSSFTELEFNAQLKRASVITPT